MFNKLNKGLLGVFVVLSTTLALAGTAHADAASTATALVDAGSSEINSVIPIVAIGLIGIAVSMFVVRWVTRAIKRGGVA